MSNIYEYIFQSSSDEKEEIANIFIHYLSPIHCIILLPDTSVEKSINYFENYFYSYPIGFNGDNPKKSFLGLYSMCTEKGKREYDSYKYFMVNFPFLDFANGLLNIYKKSRIDKYEKGCIRIRNLLTQTSKTIFQGGKSNLIFIDEYIEETLMIIEEQIAYK